MLKKLEYSFRFSILSYVHFYYFLIGMGNRIVLSINLIDSVLCMVVVIGLVIRFCFIYYISGLVEMVG